MRNSGKDYLISCLFLSIIILISSFIIRYNTNIRIEYIDSNLSLENENIDLKNEINDIKNLVNINKLNTDKKAIYGEVIRRSSNYWFNYITVNKGSKNGVKKGNIVTDNEKVIGIVEKVYKNMSKIKLLTSNSKNYLSVKVINNDKEYFGIINKYNVVNNEFSMESVVGDLPDLKDKYVVTSGLDGIPSGLTVGKVKEIKKDKYNLSNTIILSPTSNYNNIKIVRIILND